MQDGTVLFIACYYHDVGIIIKDKHTPNQIVKKRKKNHHQPSLLRQGTHKREKMKTNGN